MARLNPTGDNETVAALPAGDQLGIENPSKAHHPMGLNPQSVADSRVLGVVDGRLMERLGNHRESAH
jgi:hypothetical protein